jgi:hypothetical protein
MTEDEWHNGVDTHRMLSHVKRQHRDALDRMQRRLERAAVEAMDRRIQLFLVACCRRIQHLFTCEWQRFALDMAEEYTPVTEGPYRRDLVSLSEQFREQLESVDPEVHLAVHTAVLPHELSEATDHLLRRVSGLLGQGKHLQARKNNPMAEVEYAEFLRDIFGNPFRPVVFDSAWRTSAAVAVASQMYDSRDFTAMPILADALQDAGCENADILTHCRGPGPHARGCWVVDHILGKP